MESDIKYIRIFSRDSRVLRFSSRILDLALMSFPIPARFSILAHPKTYSSIVAIEYQCKYRSCGFFFPFFSSLLSFYSLHPALFFAPPSRETIFYDSRRLLSRPVPAASTFFPSARDLEELRYLFRAFSDPRTVVKKYQTIERISGIPNRGLRSLQFKKTLCISIHPFQVITISFLFLPTNDIIIREFIRVYFILFYRR